MKSIEYNHYLNHRTINLIFQLEVTSHGEWVRLIPSLDGGIYRFDGEDVEALPVTVDTLLHSSFKFNDDTIFSGRFINFYYLILNYNL